MDDEPGPGTALPAGSMVLEGSTDRCLVFLPGFCVPPTAYRSLLAPVAASGTTVVVPHLARLSRRLLTGQVTPDDEADRATALVRSQQASNVWLGGHSRGGLVAWLSAIELAPQGLLLIDPVAGGGPPWSSSEPLPKASPDCPTLIVGCGIGGRCAPAGRNHEVFATRHARAVHTVLAECGHADVLDAGTGRLGSLLCGGAPDRTAARVAVTALLLGFLRSDGTTT